MKKTMALWLALALVLGGCSGASGSLRVPLTFYYPRAEVDFSQGSSYIVAEMREGDGIGSDPIDILALYLRGPSNTEAFSSPFPEGTRPESFVLEDDVAQITLSAEFATCSGLELTVACACLTKTCLALTQAQLVRIRCAGALIGDAEYVEMDERSILLFDDVQAEQNNGRAAIPEKNS